MTEFSGRRVLLLEDESIVRGGIRALIRLAEPLSEVMDAASYDQAIALLDANCFDLAFLDYDLKSDRTGLDVLRWIRAHELATRVVIVSGTDDRQVVHDCVEAGACGYIPKGMDAESMGASAAEDVFRHAIDTVFRDCLYLPVSVFGRGGHTPRKPNPVPVVLPESLGLSPRAVEALFYLCQGLPNKSIARKMNISESTVRKDYVTAIFRAVGVSRRTELVVEISRRGIRVPAPAGFDSSR